MSIELSVWLHGKHVGALAPHRNGARFAFDDAVAARHAGSPLLSTALPVRSEPFDAAATANWFSGLLPEETRLDEVRRFYGIAGEEYLDVLGEIGWECAGAVQVLPEGTTPAAAGGVAPLSAAELAQRLAALPSHPYDDARTMRFSLGGFQEKLCIVGDMCTGRQAGTAGLREFGMPRDSMPTTHILKPQPAAFPGLTRAEAWAMTAAGAATPTAHVALLDWGQVTGPETLVVERFDRTISADGTVKRMHQEDCCQALGLAPSRKYATESTPKKSDPSFAGIARLLARYADDVNAELETLLRQMTVNVALGNTDAHAKNFALLHEGGLVRLAPLYDVVPAREITPGTLSMGMRIDGRIRIDRIRAEQLLGEAASWGLTRKHATAVLQETLEALRAGIEHAGALYPAAACLHEQPALERLAALLP